MYRDEGKQRDANRAAAKKYRLRGMTERGMTEQGMTEVVLDSAIPCRVVKTDDRPKLDLEKDLNLDLAKDLGVSSWSEQGIVILPEITITQVRRIRDLVGAKNGWEKRVYIN